MRVNNVYSRMQSQEQIAVPDMLCPKLIAVIRGEEWGMSGGCRLMGRRSGMLEQ